MEDPTPRYTEEELTGDDVSKKDLVTYLQEIASYGFLVDHKLKGAVKNVVKGKTKDQLIDNYRSVFSTKAFKTEDDAEEEATATAAAAATKLVDQAKKLTVKETEDEGPPKYTKRTTKKGNRTNFPRKGDTVGVFYTGKLGDGTVFDQNAISTKKFKKAQPLRFKVGIGAVVRGLDEALLTMSAGEKADVVIEPEWGYAKKGLEGKIPPNSTLYFEVELVTID